MPGARGGVPAGWHRCHRGSLCPGWVQPQLGQTKPMLSREGRVSSGAAPASAGHSPPREAAHQPGADPPGSGQGLQPFIKCPIPGRHRSRGRSGGLPAPRQRLSRPSPFLPAWLSHGRQRMEQPSQVRKQIHLPNSSRIPELGDGDAALLRRLRCCSLASVHPELPPRLQSQDPPSAPRRSTALSATT